MNPPRNIYTIQHFPESPKRREYLFVVADSAVEVAKAFPSAVKIELMDNEAVVLNELSLGDRCIEVLQHLGKDAAVKLYREETGVTMTMAVVAVEYMRDRDPTNG